MKQAAQAAFFIPIRAGRCPLRGRFSFAKRPETIFARRGVKHGDGQLP